MKDKVESLELEELQKENEGTINYCRCCPLALSSQCSRGKNVSLQK